MMNISTTKPAHYYRSTELDYLSIIESNPPEMEGLDRVTPYKIPERKEVPTSDTELNPAKSSEVNIPHALESISQDLKLLRQPEENIAESEEADEIEIDYSEMELRARVKIPAGVNWEKAFSGAKTYSDVFNFQYDLDSEE